MRTAVPRCRLVTVRHKRVGKAAPSETETQLELPGDQYIRVGFNSIGVVELLSTQESVAHASAHTPVDIEQRQQAAQPRRSISRVRWNTYSHGDGQMWHSWQ
jgi:hypothetical protein